jgi:hypothetical protein
MRYFSESIRWLVEMVANSEFPSLPLWRHDPNTGVRARACRDQELFLDLAGNLDADV